MRAYERFMKYIQYDTTSDERSETCPSTAKQLVLAKELVEEMKALGLQDVRMDEHGYVYGCVPANEEGRPVIGLIAHMDTADDVPALPMNPRIIENYDGGAVVLENGMVLDPKLFPETESAKGKDLIVTDGNTLLGADDKAGIAEILTACEKLIADPSIPHGKVMIGFTPDEEIGRGANLFDLKGFGADFAYTVDGGIVGGIAYETFNAASAQVNFHGRSVHPGSAKNIMRNAALLAMEFNSMLPANETPEHTEGYEGFYHLVDMGGEIENAHLAYIIRDHHSEKFAARKANLQRIAQYMNDKYGETVVDLTIKDSYFNMKEIIKDHMDIIDLAGRAFAEVGVDMFVEPVRGGTDGARLSFEGLPCPNLSTGGMNCHGRFECIPVQDLDLMADMLVKLVSIEK